MSRSTHVTRISCIRMRPRPLRARAAQVVIRDPARKDHTSTSRMAGGARIPGLVELWLLAPFYGSWLPLPRLHPQCAYLSMTRRSPLTIGLHRHHPGHFKRIAMNSQDVRPHIEDVQTRAVIDDSQLRQCDLRQICRGWHSDSLILAMSKTTRARPTSCHHQSTPCTLR